MFEQLPGYDPSYRHGSNPDVDAAMAELLQTGGGIVCLDQDGQVVSEYTDRVALSLPDTLDDEHTLAAHAAALRVVQLMNPDESNVSPRREPLPGYNSSYRYGSNPELDAAIDVLNRTGCGIACLDSEGQVVQEYTDHVALELPEGTDSQIVTAGRAAALRVLQLMNPGEA